MIIDKDIIKEKARKIANLLKNPEGFDDSTFEVNFQYVIQVLKDTDKIDVLYKAIQYINKDLQEHICSKPEACPMEKKSKYAIYILEQELDGLKAVVTDDTNFQSADMFTKEELEKLNDKIDEILYHVQLNNVGHELLYQEIERSKNLATKLTSKDFKLFFLGILGVFGQKALSELPSIKELLEIGKDYINIYLNP